MSIQKFSVMGKKPNQSHPKEKMSCQYQPLKTTNQFNTKITPYFDLYFIRY